MDQVIGNAEEKEEVLVKRKHDIKEAQENWRASRPKLVQRMSKVARHQAVLANHSLLYDQCATTHIQSSPNQNKATAKIGIVHPLCLSP